MKQIERNLESVLILEEEGLIHEANEIKGGVLQCGLVIYIKKSSHLKAKEKYLETQIFHYAKI
jgi:hypothetical protein